MEFDPRLKHPFTCMVVGPTQCGKTRFVLELIRRSSSIHPPPERIVWCFGCYQDLFRNVDGVEFVEGVPDMNILDGGKKRTLLIIDDLMSETDSRMTKTSTKGSHHLNCSVIYISQNLFNKGKENRNICLNTHYLVLFKNPRDFAQILHLGRQIFPDAIKYFKESFADATSLPYDYLLIDLRTTTPEDLRLRTDIFSDDRTVVYVQRVRTLEQLVKNINKSFQNSTSFCSAINSSVHSNVHQINYCPTFSPAIQMIASRTETIDASLLQEMRNAIKDLMPSDILRVIKTLAYSVFSKDELASNSLTGKRSIHSGDKARLPLEKQNVAGENVLVLSTQPKKPLCLQYDGPYKIIKKVSPVDHLISFPGKRKPERVLHVNLLRKYVPRTEFVGVIHGEQRSIDNDIEECLDGIESIASKNGIADKFDEKLFNDKIAHLTVNQGIKIREIVNKYSQVISDKPGCCKDFLCKIRLKPEAKPVQSRPNRLSPSQQQWLREEINELMNDGLIEPACSEWASPTLVVPKPEAGKFRCVIDYRKANPLIEGDSFPMARVDDLLDRIGQAKILSKFDLCKGFYQVLLDEASRPITSFCTPFGVFQWKRLPMGMKTSPAAFNAMLAKALSGLEDICGLYLDDIVVFSKSWEEHIRHIELILQRLKSYGLTIKLSKCFFACPEIEFLGHMVGFGTVSPKQLKVMDLLNTTRPEGKRQLQSWLGLSGYYQRYIPKYAELSAPLTDLLKKDEKFNWNDKADKSFNDIKCLLAQKPVLKIADFSKPFVIFVDASSIASAAILMQTDENDVLHPICYYSKKHNKSQLNYTTTDLEALALVLAIRAFRIYLSGHTTIYTDHEALHYIHNNATKNKRLLRWSMELQQFDLKIEHVKGKDNIFADYLSRHVSDNNVLCLSEVNQGVQ